MVVRVIRPRSGRSASSGSAGGNPRRVAVWPMAGRVETIASGGTAIVLIDVAFLDERCQPHVSERSLRWRTHSWAASRACTAADVAFVAIIVAFSVA